MMQLGIGVLSEPRRRWYSFWKKTSDWTVVGYPVEDGGTYTISYEATVRSPIVYVDHLVVSSKR